MGPAILPERARERAFLEAAWHFGHVVPLNARRAVLHEAP